MERIAERVGLDAQERYLLALAAGWREAERLPPPPVDDGARLVEIAIRNRMQTLLAGVLDQHDGWEALPTEARQALEAARERLREHAALFSDALRDYLLRAAARGLETVVIKGLSLSINIYGDPAMRPGGDIDILVRRDRVAESLEILLEMGIGPYWPNLMDDRYYERHHLHQQRCTPDRRIWFEIHWALDHPLTRLTVDYDRMLDRARPATLLDAPVIELTPADELLTLTLHLVKHAMYLPIVVERPDLARIVLADGMLMYFVDIAELVAVHEESLDWEAAIRDARGWGAVTMLGAVLRVCVRLLDAPVPDWVMEALPLAPAGPVSRRVLEQAVAYEVDAHMGRQRSRIWDLLLVTNGAFILRPIRLLEIASYLFPGEDYLQRRYGLGGRLMATGHLLRATAQYGRAGVDTLYFLIERYRRMKAADLNASLFNRLDDED